MTSFEQAIQAAATRGDFSVAQTFLDELHAAHAAKQATLTKVVAWTTASGAVALSTAKTPTDADAFAADLRAAGKANVEVVDA